MTDTYLERMYAGVLGKIIGVYMGRPVENQGYEAIHGRYGEVDRYVHAEAGFPLVITDDDIAGTFTFVRALEDHGFPARISPAQVGQTWLNYIIENRTILWWGGLYHSTEHTAYLNLKGGIPAPESGSIRRNGPVIANQIGAQIYCDGWALLCPGDPERAADLAARAASVSHDDEALNAARMVAAMEAQAFVEQDIERLIDAGLEQIPRDSLIARLVADLREWRCVDQDWRKTRERIAAEYGYKKYPGGCHVVPNHALIHLGLLYGGGDFRKSLAICITSGWDTDCNAGNLGCLLAVRGGLASIPPDLREPVADRLFVTSADGGRCISDALTETFHLYRAARRINGLVFQPPKARQGMAPRFHFSLPGSIQGFAVWPEAAALANAPLPGDPGARGLEIRWPALPPGQEVLAAAPVFIRPDELSMHGYQLVASPALYPGQRVRARVLGGAGNRGVVRARPFIWYYDADDRPARLDGPPFELAPGAPCELDWTVPDTNGGPVYEIGLALADPAGGLAAGSAVVDWLGWEGAPNCTFTRPAGSSLPFSGPLVFRRAWVDSVDQWEPWWQQAFRLIQNRGRGLISTGTREWVDYTASARVTVAMFHSGGIAVRVQGLRRFYALLLVIGGTARLVRALDDEDTILAEKPFLWEIWRPYELRLSVRGSRLMGWIDGELLFDLEDPGCPLAGGGVGLVVDRGHMAAPAVRVEPA